MKEQYSTETEAIEESVDGNGAVDGDIGGGMDIGIVAIAVGTNMVGHDAISSTAISMKLKCLKTVGLSRYYNVDP